MLSHILKSTVIGCIGALSLGYTAASHAEFNPMSNLANVAKEISESTDGRVNLSGYINAHYMKHDGVPEFTNKDLNQPLYQIREASLFADIVLSDTLLFSTELEMSYDFTDKDDSGRSDRFEAVLNYYYVDWSVSDAMDWDSDENGTLNLRAGRILVPFLSYNLNKPSFKQHLMSQPFTAWQLAPVNNVAINFQQFGWTDTGLMANWDYSNDTGVISTKLAVINGLGTETSVLDSNTVQLNPPGAMKPTVRPRDGLANARSEWDDFNDVNDNKAVVIQLSIAPYSTPLNGGISWYKGAWDKAGDQDLLMWGVHANYAMPRWEVKGEYAKANIEQTAGINVVTVPGPAGVNTSTGDYDMRAWYVEGSYSIFGPTSGSDKNLIAIVRYDEVNTNDKATFSPFNRTRVTLGMEWEFIKNTRLRAEWQKSRLTDFSAAPAPFIGAGGEEDVTMTMFSLIAYF